jgi:hypothetical protein
MRSVLVIAVGLGLVACVPAPVYRVQRTARVPHPAVPLRTGEPLAGPVELSVGASSIGDVLRPKLVDEQASIEVAREQIRTELRFRLGKRGELAPIVEAAVGRTVALDDTQAPVEDGMPAGFGLAARYSFATGAPGFSIGLGLETMSWQIPYVEYRTCVEYCEENNAPTMQKLHGREGVYSFAVSLVPTYRVGRLALFAGGYTRRHPTIKRKGTELYEMSYERDVHGGNYNLMVHAGAEYRLTAVSFLATVHQDLTAEPVQYGPSFGFAIAFRVPDDKPLPRWSSWKNEPARPAPPAPTTYGPPGAPANHYDANLPDDPW